MGIGYAPAGAVEYEAVVAAFDSATAKLACGERGKAMGATVEQRGDSGLASEQDKRRIEQCSRHRTGVELIGPGGLVPAVAKIERRISCGSLVMRVATCHVHFPFLLRFFPEGPKSKVSMHRRSSQTLRPPPPVSAG